MTKLISEADQHLIYKLSYNTLSACNKFKNYKRLQINFFKLIKKL